MTRVPASITRAVWASWHAAAEEARKAGRPELVTACQPSPGWSGRLRLNEVQLATEDLRKLLERKQE
jgi:hypothetical protein